MLRRDEARQHKHQTGMHATTDTRCVDWSNDTRTELAAIVGGMITTHASITVTVIPKIMHATRAYLAMLLDDSTVSSRASTQRPVHPQAPSSGAIFVIAPYKGAGQCETYRQPQTSCRVHDI